MKFVYNIYVLMIILRSAWVVQNAANFTLNELTHISRELNPMECMRLLEAIYSAIPKEKKPRALTIRETPLSKWISKKSCLSELQAWNRQFSDKTEPRARVIMTLHLNSLGRADLANYVRKKGDHDQKNGIISGEIISKTDYQSQSKKMTHTAKRARVSRRSDQYDNVHQSMIAAISGGTVSNGRKPGAGRTERKKPKHAASVSKNSLYLIIALGIVVAFICGIVFLIFRKSLRSSPCLGERSDLCPGNNPTQEKGLQCFRFLNDQGDYETRSNLASQISEIDVEGGSCFDSLGAESPKNFSAAVLCSNRNTPGVSVEELELFEEGLDTGVLEDALPQSSCRCRPLEKKICGTRPIKKKKKKKTKTKSKEETRTARSYLKAMQEKILPRQRRQVNKDSTFDMKQFQEKILAILNQECGACRCCNCTSHWEKDSPKVSRSTKNEERCCVREEKKDRKKKYRCEKSSITKGCDKEVLTYETSETSRSPTSSRRSTRRQESDSAKKAKIQNKEKSRKSGSSRTKRTRDNKALLSSSASSETDHSQNSNNDNSKRSKQKEASVNTFLSAHDKPKRFF